MLNRTPLNILARETKLKAIETSSERLVNILGLKTSPIVSNRVKDLLTPSIVITKEESKQQFDIGIENEQRQIQKKDDPNLIEIEPKVVNSNIEINKSVSEITSVFFT